MKRTILLFSLVLVFVFGVSWQAFAQSDKDTAREVIKLVNNAADFLSEKGKAGVEEFKDKDGRFVKEDIYVYVGNCDKNTAVAHPFKSEIVGKDLSNLQDPKGNYFALEMCMVKKERPQKGGWIEYWWPKPGEGEPTRKVSYVKQVPGTPYHAVAGFWTESKSVEELNSLAGKMYKDSQ